jgi:hypothetical protein
VPRKCVNEGFGCKYIPSFNVSSVTPSNYIFDVAAIFLVYVPKRNNLKNKGYLLKI